ncbi:MAG: hypothetical protein R3C20_11350 [Planctomycetaceae bacterium]
MRRCIKPLLLALTVLTVVSNSANACIYCPLLNPFSWFHDPNPYATRRVIDDWLGYGYLRGNQDGSLGHYPGRPFSCYTPWFSGLTSPPPAMNPCFVPRTIPQPAPVWRPPALLGPQMMQPQMMPQPGFSQPAFSQPGCSQCSPMMAAPLQAPLMQAPVMPWAPAPAFNGDCGCGSFPVNDPCCGQMPAPPVAVRVPVTTYRPVTVDRGSYQMVWVPRPVTQMMPQTSWTTQYVQQQPTMMAPSMNYQMPSPAYSYPSAPMMMPGSTGCSDCGSGSVSLPEGLPSTTTVPSTMTVPDATTWAPAGSGIPAQSFGTSAFTAQNWQYAPRYPTPQYSMIPQYGMAPAQRAYPMPYGFQPGGMPGYNTAALYPSTMNYSQPVPQMAAPQYVAAPAQSAIPYYSGDVMGDHEYDMIVPTPATLPPSNTAMAPVLQNSFRSRNVPVRTMSYASPLSPASARKYPNAVW